MHPAQPSPTKPCPPVPPPTACLRPTSLLPACLPEAYLTPACLPACTHAVVGTAISTGRCARAGTSLPLRTTTLTSKALAGRAGCGGWRLSSLAPPAAPLVAFQPSANIACASPCPPAASRPQPAAPCYCLLCSSLTGGAMRWRVKTWSSQTAMATK